MPSSKVPKKYIPDSLSAEDKKKLRKELRKSRKKYSSDKYHTRKKVKSYDSKTSKHVKNAMKIYDIKSVKPNKKLSKETGCSVKSLKKIVKKGMGAYYSSGSRPNQTAHSWGRARLASAITGGKSAAVDFNILKEGCDKRMKAYRLAKKSRKKHNKGKRKVPKTKL